MSDIRQFEEIRPILESARKHTYLIQNDLYNLFCDVLYILERGWHILPKDYPQLCYYYFRVWSEKKDSGASILDKIF